MFSLLEGVCTVCTGPGGNDLPGVSGNDLPGVPWNDLPGVPGKDLSGVPDGMCVVGMPGMPWLCAVGMLCSLPAEILEGASEIGNVLEGVDRVLSTTCLGVLAAPARSVDSLDM